MSKELAVTSADYTPMTAEQALWDAEKFKQLQRIAGMYADSGLVPNHFQGNLAACAVGLQLATQMGLSPFMVFQKIYVIKGTPSIEAQLAIALANKARVFKGPIEYKFEGELAKKTLKCTASAVLSSNGAKIEMELDWATVEANGWHDKRDKFGKNQSKWTTMPHQMFRYRTAMWLIKAHVPEVLFGLSSTDELEDAQIIDVTPRKTIGEAFAELKTVEAEPVEEVQAEVQTEPKPETKTKAAKPEPKPEPKPTVTKTEPKAEPTPKPTPKPEPAPKAEPKSSEDLQKLLDEIDSYKISVITAYVVRAVGTNKKREDWTAEDAAKILEEIKKMKAGK